MLLLLLLLLVVVVVWLLVLVVVVVIVVVVVVVVVVWCFAELRVRSSIDRSHRIDKTDPSVPSRALRHN